MSSIFGDIDTPTTDETTIRRRAEMPLAVDEGVGRIMETLEEVRHPDLDELYDLEIDPFEEHNLVDDPGSASVREELRAELGRQILDALGLGG